MSKMQREKLRPKLRALKKRTILFWSFILVDEFLHASSELGVLDTLSKRGYRIFVSVVRSKKRVKEKQGDVNFILLPLRYVPIVTPFLFTLISIIVFPFFIIRKKPSYIIVGPGPGILIFLWRPLLNLFKCKVVLDVRSTPVEIVGFRGFLIRMMFDLSVNVAKRIFDGIITLTEAMKEELCNSYGIESRFIGVRTSGVSTSMFDPELYDGSLMREKLGLKNKFIVFYHGDFGIYRGLLEAIKSIKLLPRDYEDVVLFLLGDGPALDSMRKLVDELDLEGKVIIHEPVDYREVPKYIAMCDVGLVTLPDIPDWRNQCPLKLLEYLAMEKVVIVTDILANREIVGENKCGIYISSIDPDNVAAAIIHAYKNRDLLNEWGSHGRLIVEEKYDWNKVAEELDIYLNRLSA